MNGRTWIVLAAAGLLLSSGAASIGEAPSGPQKGYVARPCGLDMNRNGILGEAADALVGDGVTKDVDGDGVEEDILYVDSETGSDESGDGSPQKPFKTIQKALDAADGPADGAEDIICISGTFHEALSLTQGGVAGHYERDGFQFPSNPFMIVGWDRDRDGQYPPYDKDDVAVLDGRDELNIAITNKPNKVSFVEMAHLTIKRYGNTRRQGRPDRGAIRFSGVGSGRQSHLYVHDVEIVDVITRGGGGSNTITISFWSRKNTITDIAVINTLIDGLGCFGFRGAPHNGSGRFRFQNLTIKFRALPGGGASGWKLWEQHSGVEILDCVLDGDVRNWKIGRGPVGVVVCQCAQDWTIRGNIFKDLRCAVFLQGTSKGYCTVRPVSNIVIDRNVIRQTYDKWPFYPVGIRIGSGATTTGTTGDVTITNNFISTTTGLGSAIQSQAGNHTGPQPGTITIAGNTLYGPFFYFGIFISRWASFPQIPYIKFPQDDFVIKNNIIANTGGYNRNVGVNYAPKNLLANGNLYDDAGFLWDNKIRDNFADWQRATAQDANSRTGKAAFVDAAAGDFHLKKEDAAAKGVGVDITGITKVDIDGQPRSAAKPAAGADVP